MTTTEEEEAVGRTADLDAELEELEAEAEAGPPERPGQPEEAEETDDRLDRYDAWERLLHWATALAFVALLVSGLALAYPRLAWLDVFFGGGQTMRATHPWFGLAFTAGMVVMLAIWVKDMLFHKVDWAWFRRLGRYARTGHAGLDIGRWNAGQKGYFWVALAGAVILLITGIPLWDRDLTSLGIIQLSRLLHHVLFLIMVGGFIIHVLLSAFLFPGTMEGMLSGKVTKAWAAFHHPRWFRQQTGREPADPGEGDLATEGGPTGPETPPAESDA